MDRRLQGNIGRGTLASLHLHAILLVPFLVVAWRMAAREEAQRAEEVDVSWEAEAEGELPPDLPALQPEEIAREPATPEKKRREKRPVPAKPEQALAAADEKPEPEVVVPPLPPMPQEPPKPQPMPELHATPVDLDMGKDVPPPPDAKYLAQKNNRTDVETRATDTVLDKNQAGVEASSPSKRENDRIGDDVDRERIAETEEQKSAAGRSAPSVTPHAEAQAGENRSESSESLLSMRAHEARQHELTPETADPSLPRDPDGVQAEARDDVRGPRDRASKVSSGKRLKLRITGEDYEHIYGADAEAERKFAQTQRTKRPGRFQERLGRVRAALENFTPEVRPGNQTALNTRAAPFAAFIARMHRSIHKLWGFGILEEWDDKGTGSPFNDRHLTSTLEIVLNADGTVDKVTVVRNSGYLPFDAAAVDVVYSAGPYAEPPGEIRSKNGKIYLHWAFNRDERQCHPSGASPFILDNAPAGSDGSGAQAGLPASAPPPRVPGENGPRRLERPVKSDSAHRAKMRQLDAEAGTPEGDPAAARRAAEQVADPEDPDAFRVAQTFFAGYGSGQVQPMVAQAAFPFRAGDGGTAAADAAELGAQLKALIDETPKRTVHTVRIFSAAGLRGVLGKLPVGLREGGGTLYAVAQAGGDGWILVLDRRQGHWKGVALVRR